MAKANACKMTNETQRAVTEGDAETGAVHLGEKEKRDSSPSFVATPTPYGPCFSLPSSGTGAVAANLPTDAVPSEREGGGAPDRGASSSTTAATKEGSGSRRRRRKLLALALAALAVVAIAVGVGVGLSGGDKDDGAGDGGGTGTGGEVETPSGAPSPFPTSSSSAFPSMQPSALPSASPSFAPTIPSNSTTIAVLALSIGGGATATAIDEALVIAAAVGGKLDPGSVVVPSLYGRRPVVELAFRVEVPLEYDAASMAGDVALRNAFVVALLDERDDEVIPVSSCAFSCPGDGVNATLLLDYFDPPTDEATATSIPRGYCHPPSDECFCTGQHGGASCDAACRRVDAAESCDALSPGCAWCNATAKCLPAKSVARTTDETESCPGCADLTGLDALCRAAPMCAHCASTGECADGSDDNWCPFGVVSTSPVNGEAAVALTRETVVYFSEAVEPASVGVETVLARSAAAADGLDATLHLSADGLKLTIFYAETLPANGIVRIEITNGLESVSGRALRNNTAFEFETLGVLPVPDTYVCGRVFASEQDQAEQGEWLDVPLPGVTVSVDGSIPKIEAETGLDGAFVLGPLPAGKFFVHIDGRTVPKSAFNSSSSSSSYYPNVGKAWTAAAGQMTNVETIHLPLVTDGTLQELHDSGNATVIGFSSAVIGNDPSLEQVSISVPPGALIGPDGNPAIGGKVGIAPVDRNRLPGTLPPTLRLPLVITVQTDGGTNFDAPVSACFPNAADPETGVVPGPGESSSLWSFDHDKGRFEVVGAGTVSPDGNIICSDPGSGIVAPGWHGFADGSPLDSPFDQPGCDSAAMSEAQSSLGSALFGCAKNTIGDMLGKPLKTVFDCAVAIHSVASSYNSAHELARPTAQQAVDSALGLSGATWGYVRDCSGGLFTTLVPVGRTFSLILNGYKCARGLQKAFQAVSACSSGSQSPGNSRMENALNGIDSVISLAEAFNIIRRRRLAELPKAVSDEDVDSILAYLFFGNDLDWYKRLTIEGINSQFTAIATASDNGLTDEEIIGLADSLYDDMKRVENMTAAMLLLEDLIEEVGQGFNEMWDEVTSLASEAEGPPIVTGPGRLLRVIGAKRKLWFYIYTESGDEFRITTTDKGEIVGFVLPPLTTYSCIAYDVANTAIGFATGVTSPNGVRSVLPSMTFFPPSSLPDSDGDGLCDVCEFIIGTNDQLQDSDSDGKGDLQELLDGTNPLDGLAITTGVVGNFPLAGVSGTDPTAVAAVGSKVYLAMIGGGVAVYNAFNALLPTLTNVMGSENRFAQISAREDAVLGLTSSGDVVLFSGDNYATITDVSARFGDIIRKASSVYLGDTFGFVGLVGGVAAFSSDFVAHVQTVSTETQYPVDSMGLTPSGHLVALSGRQSHLFRIDLLTRHGWETTPSTVSPVSSLLSMRKKLSIGINRMYAASYDGGLTVLDTYSGAVLGTGRRISAPLLGWIPTESNGGNAVSLSHTPGTNRQALVQLWNVDNPSAPDFRAGFQLNGLSYTRKFGTIASANGFFYVGLPSGLAVVNVFSPDTAGNAPTMTAFVVYYESQLHLDGFDVEEGQTLRLIVEVVDDVVVRQVLFSASSSFGGVQTRMASTFPYRASITVPQYVAGNSTLNLTATAWDASGNVAPPATRTFNIVQDMRPPLINVLYPRPNSTVLSRVTAELDVVESLTLALSFSEDVVLSNNVTSFIHADHEGLPVPMNNASIAFSVASNQLRVVIPSQILELGIYSVWLTPGLAADVAGNPTEPMSWSFELVSNQLFLDKTATCSPTPTKPCVFEFSPPHEPDFAWQPVALSVIPSPSHLKTRVHKGPDITYPVTYDGSCWGTSRFLINLKAFVISPFTATYTVEVTSDSSSQDVHIALSGSGQQVVDIGERVSGKLYADGVFPRFYLPNSVPDRPLVFMMDAIQDTTLGLVPSTGVQSGFGIEFWLHSSQRINLKHGTDYWLYVMPIRFDSRCSYLSDLDSIPGGGLNYSFSIWEPVLSKGPALDFGETSTCTVPNFGDYCDFTFDVSSNMVGIPFSFHLQPRSFGGKPFRPQLFVYYESSEVFQDSCYLRSDFELSVMAQFVPEASGQHTLRVSDYSRYPRSTGYINVTLGSNPTDAKELPLNTIIEGSWTHPADVQWYDVPGLGKGDELVVSLHDMKTSLSGRVKVFTQSGHLLMEKVCYACDGRSEAVIDGLMIGEGQAIRIAFAPYSSCSGMQWSDAVGKNYKLAVWRKEKKAQSTNLTSAPSVAFGGSAFCSIAAVRDYCQFQLKISAAQVGLPLSFSLQDVATEPGFPVFRPKLELLKNGKVELSESCFFNKELGSYGRYVPQSVGEVELRAMSYYPSLGNVTILVGNDPSTYVVDLNNEEDRARNFTLSLSGEHDQEATPLIFRFFASAGDSFSANDSEENVNFVAIMDLPSGQILKEGYLYFSPVTFNVQHTSTYALMATPVFGWGGTCHGVDHWPSTFEYNLTVTKESGFVPVSNFPPPEQAPAGSAPDVLSTINFRCNVSTVGLEGIPSCAYFVEVSEDASQVPMTVFIALNENDAPLSVHFKVFHSESYPTEQFGSFLTCTMSEDEYALSVGSFSFPRSGLYVFLLQVSLPVTSTIVDLSVGAGIYDEAGTSLSSLANGDRFQGGFTEQKMWKSFQLHVQEPSHVALDIADGDGLLTMIGPDGSEVETHADALQATVYLPGIYTAVITPPDITSYFGGCFDRHHWDDNMNTNFTLSFHMGPAYPPIESFPSISVGDTIECSVLFPFGKCFFKLDVLSDQVRMPLSLFPEVVSMDNNTSGTHFRPRMLVSEPIQYPGKHFFSFESCRSTLGDTPRTRPSLGSLIFTRAGAYVLEVSNADGALTGSLRLSIGPPHFDVVTDFPNSVTSEPLVLQETFNYVGQVHNFALENITSDLLVQVQSEFGGVWPVAVPDYGSGGRHVQFTVPPEEHSVGATLLMSPSRRSSCHNQGTNAWYTGVGVPYSVSITVLEEYPKRPLPIIAIGDEFNCTISNPSMHCAYEFVITNDDAHKILPVYFEAVSKTADGSWSSGLEIAFANEYPDSKRFSDFYYYSQAWASTGFVAGQPGTYTLRTGNFHANRAERAAGTFKIHFGKGTQHRIDIESLLNEELPGSGNFMDSFPFFVRKGTFVAVEMRPQQNRRLRVIDYMGEEIFLYSPFSFLRFEAKTAGMHQAVVEPEWTAGWGDASNDTYKLFVWESNPKPITERIALVENGFLDFECTIDRPWSYCGFVLAVADDQIGNSLSILTSNVRNIAGQEVLSCDNWRTQIHFDRGDYQEDLGVVNSNCCDGTYRHAAFMPLTAGQYTVRIGNRESLPGVGSFEIGFSDFFRPRQTLSVGEVIARNFTRWADSHSFKVPSSGDDYVLLVEAAEDIALHVMIRQLGLSGGTSTFWGTGTVQRTLVAQNDVFIEVSLASSAFQCGEDLDQLMGVPLAESFTVLLNLEA